jgi:hypothetical protein
LVRPTQLQLLAPSGLARQAGSGVSCEYRLKSVF